MCERCRTQLVCIFGRGTRSSAYSCWVAPSGQPLEHSACIRRGHWVTRLVTINTCERSCRLRSRCRLPWLCDSNQGCRCGESWGLFWLRPHDEAESICLWATWKSGRGWHGPRLCLQLFLPTAAEEMEVGVPWDPSLVGGFGDGPLRGLTQWWW